MSRPACASVVIPAYNEGRVLGRCLDALRAAAASLPGPLEIVVAANGCTDDTVAVARAYDGITVLDLPSPGKPGALRAGDAAATAFPRIYLDADIELSPEALPALVAVLTTDAARVAAPRVRFDASVSDAAVRAFYAVYAELPYVRHGMVGLGVYGMSAAGRARFGEFPDVQADDLFIQRLFAPAERVTTAGTFTVRAPRDLASLLKVRTRIARGNAELAGRADLLPPPPQQPPGPDGLSAAPAGPDPGGPAPAAGAGSGRTDAAPDAPDFGSTAGSTVAALGRLVLHRPALAPAAGLYLGIGALARRRARTGAAVWDRDDSTR